MFLFDTRGLRNVSSNCFLNCLFMSMFGYLKSPFYSVFDNKNLSKDLRMIFLDLIRDVNEDEYPDISPIRELLPNEMQYGQQDCSETFDELMKILKYDPMVVIKKKEYKDSNGSKKYLKKEEMRVPYVNLYNNGKENYNPLRELFFSKSWEDLGSDPSNWVNDDSGNPRYRYMRERTIDIYGDCLVFCINRCKDMYNKYDNKVLLPLSIEGEEGTYKLFSIILHTSKNTIHYGHYITVLSNMEDEMYIYDDMSGVSIKDNRIDNLKDFMEFIQTSCVMAFYYKVL